MSWSRFSHELHKQANCCPLQGFPTILQPEDLRSPVSWWGPSHTVTCSGMSFPGCGAWDSTLPRECGLARKSMLWLGFLGGGIPTETCWAVAVTLTIGSSSLLPWMAQLCRPGPAGWEPWVLPRLGLALDFPGTRGRCGFPNRTRVPRPHEFQGLGFPQGTDLQ